MSRFRTVIVALLLALGAGGASAQAADQATIEAQTRQLAAELRCPVCQGLSIEDSPTELSQQMKDVIRKQLESGKSPQDVRDYFVSRYGEWILLEPEPRGFNLVAYLLPYAVLLAGAAVLFWKVRQWTAPTPGGEEAVQ